MQRRYIYPLCSYRELSLEEEYRSPFVTRPQDFVIRPPYTDVVKRPVLHPTSPFYRPFDQSTVLDYRFDETSL
jgi:hypothetical protein